MQSLLTAATTATVLLFAVLAIIDFASGLVATWQAAGAKPQLQAERSRKFAEPLSSDVEPAIAPKVDLAELQSDIWAMKFEERAIALPTEQPIVKQQLLLAPAPQKIASLEWLVEHMPVPEVYVAEMPCAIAMSKSKQPKVVAPIAEIATKEQLHAVGIRKCKRLASQLGVRNYSNLKLLQLVERLEGRVLQSQLVA